jgi:hypothetical protein
MGCGGLVSEFHLPEPNLFIAEDTSVIATEEETEGPKHPLKIRSDEVRGIWLKGTVSSMGNEREEKLEQKFYAAFRTKFRIGVFKEEAS